MNTVLELHDSRVAEIAQRDGMVTVHFQPAYLHKSEGRPGFDPGTGWVQEARLKFSEATTSGEFPDWPCDLRDAELIVGAERHRDQIPVPFESAMVTELRLICDAAHTVTVTGRAAILELLGEPSYVEEYRAHHSPS